MKVKSESESRSVMSDSQRPHGLQPTRLLRPWDSPGKSTGVGCQDLADTTLIVESEEELKNLLMKVKKESEKTALKLNIQKTKIMAFSPITSWYIDGETMETVTDFIFMGSKITADSDCSHEIKTFAPWNKSYDKPRQHIKKAETSLCQQRCFASQSYGFSSSHIWM